MSNIDISHHIIACVACMLHIFFNLCQAVLAFEDKMFQHICHVVVKFRRYKLVYISRMYLLCEIQRHTYLYAALVHLEIGK